MQGNEDCKASTCKKQKRIDTNERRFITVNIIEETTLHTNCWRGYKNVSKHGYIHTVNYKVNFVDLDDRSVHTQTIERL